MFDVQVFGVSAVLAIMTIVRMLQDFGLPKKFSPIVSVVLGILTGVFLVDPQDLQQGLVDGFYLGLSAIGVHSGVKNVREGVVNLLKKPTSINVQVKPLTEKDGHELAKKLEEAVKKQFQPQAQQPQQPQQ